MEQTSALVVRVWREDDGGFRARLTGAPLEGGGRPGLEATVAIVATPGDVLEAVRQWLDEFMTRTRTTD